MVGVLERSLLTISTARLCDVVARSVHCEYDEHVSTKPRNAYIIILCNTNSVRH